MIETGPLRLGFAFSAGLATFFAPCAYPMLPGYVAFFLGDLDETNSLSTRLSHAGTAGGMAAIGFLFVYAVLAGTVAAVGSRLLGNLALLGLGVGGLLVLVGGGMASGRIGTGVVHVRLPRRERSKSGFVIFGLVYAVAAAGCTAPLFVAITGVALTAGPVGAALTFLAYASGMSAVMIGLTALVALGYSGAVRRFSPDTELVTRIAGVLIVLAGVAQIYLYLFEFGGLELFGLR
ncbi:cytochrome C biogenesis protein [Halovenus sp. WSH3]|uniref:Cytochrome C biogenesis protein n=1 Tax=Halovenus carboxidivorans TaxID=2692199 RepID=A0A6B0SYI7_9EURY|nr:cytochrome c biogenesis protein CcdA [Halovenus carboxidivorans]MXR50227.1 cytochrome C biogenesis protein [Halovenus carboxidivorans]